MRIATICFGSNQGYITARKATGERKEEETAMDAMKTGKI